MSIIKIGLCGAGGRMGTAIEKLITHHTDNFTLAEKLHHAHTKDELLEFCQKTDIIIDFSHPDILKNLTETAINSGTKLLVGTTGLEQKHFEYLEEASKHVAILYAANTSLGANLIAMLASQAAQILKNYDIEIIEAHHKNKKDAPSGTALMIGQEIVRSINTDLQKHSILDRANKGPRKPGEIGFSSIRGGNIPGEHEVIFAGENELVTIGCRALSRDTFAEGALFATKWLSDKNPGLYSMKDVLEL